MRITTKDDLKRALQIEKKLYGGGYKYLIPLCLSERQVLMKYCVVLRYTEYYLNTGKRLRTYIFRLMLNRMQCKYGIIIEPNTCGIGLSIGHIGSIIINGNCSIGNNLRIHAGVCIGGNDGYAPCIGDNVYIGPGAKLFGNIQIANKVSIGANAVVTHSFLSEGVTLAGIPAKIIGHK